MKEDMNAFNILTRTPRRKWKDYIRMKLKEIDINSRNWVDLAQERNYWRARVNMALTHRVP
jgi:hypothetical protein